MRRRPSCASATLTLLTLLPMLLAGCVSNHRVSPFPPIETIDALLLPPNLDAHVKRIDDEALANGYRLRIEQRGRLPDGDEVVIRAYEARDPFGRVAHLTRVATPVGVILALGPPDPKEILSPACELVASLVNGGWSSGTDLNGDGVPEVVVKDGAGLLSAWRIERFGASPLPIDLALPATFALDVNGDGRPDFAGRVEVEEGDPISPRFLDAAVFDGARYTNEHDEVRAWHVKEREGAKTRMEEAIEEKLPTVARQAALEQAWHSVLAGKEAKAALAELDRADEKIGPASEVLRQAWGRWRAVVAKQKPRAK